MQTPEFDATHDKDIRLTPEGIEQIQATGDWIRNNLISEEGFFDACITSSYIRARESAGHLAIRGAEWQINDLVRERDWGSVAKLGDAIVRRDYPESHALKEQSPLHWQAPGGVSLASQARLRFDSFMKSLEEHNEGSALVVSHGEFIQIARFVLEHMLTEDHNMLNKDRSRSIKNAMVVHYSSRNPEQPDTEPSPMLSRVRLICPWDESLSHNGGEWQEIKKRTYSNRELLWQAGMVPRLFGE